MNDNNKINFLIVGSQKSGTTALDSYLREHPQIEMGARKELHFFDNDNNFKDNVNYDAYHTNFSSDNSKVKGESTPIYMYWESSISRIYEYNPEIKIIAILRNPITRAFSHWNMERDRNADNESFSEAIRNENNRCRSALPLQHRVFSYTDRGFYSEQIRRIWRFFPEEQTLFIKHDDLKREPNQVLNRISTYLSISSFNINENKDIHSRPYINKLSKEDYEFLYELYFHEINTLEKMLSWDCSDWKSKKENTIIKWLKRQK